MCNFPALVTEFHIIDSKLHAWLIDGCRCFLLVPCNYEPEIILYLYSSFVTLLIHLLAWVTSDKSIFGSHRILLSL